MDKIEKITYLAKQLYENHSYSISTEKTIRETLKDNEIQKLFARLLDLVYEINQGKGEPWFDKKPVRDFESKIIEDLVKIIA